MTIVHGQAELLNDAYPDKFRQEVNRKLRARGIETVLGDHIDIPDDGSEITDVTARSGRVLKADLVVCQYSYFARFSPPNVRESRYRPTVVDRTPGSYTRRSAQMY